MDAKAKFNFAPGSSRDAIVFGSERPGFTPPSASARVTPRGPLVQPPVVEEWVTYMVERGIRRVLCLLTDKELTFYNGSLIERLKGSFVGVAHVPSGTDESRQGALMAIRDAEAAKEPIVVMCTTGQERTGNVLALWLHHRYTLNIDPAVQEINSYAKAHAAIRKASATGIIRLLSPPRRPSSVMPKLRVAGTAPLPPGGSGGSTARSDVSSASSAYTYASGSSAVRGPSPIRDRPGSSVSRAGPSSSAPGMRAIPAPPAVRTSARSSFADGAKRTITFLQTGGTIDKDYPRSTRGYAFEIGTPAVTRILQRLVVPTGFTVDITSVCRKDSQDITREDRKAIMRACAVAAGDRLVVTHGTDSLIETARFLHDAVAASQLSPASASAKSGSGSSTDGKDGGDSPGAASSPGKPPRTPGSGGGVADISPHDFSSLGSILARKTIVLTGSMRPERFAESDAMFNVGAAVSAVSLLPAGVYVCMTGGVFEANKCTRDMSTGAFVACEPTDLFGPGMPEVSPLATAKRASKSRAGRGGGGGGGESGSGRGTGAGGGDSSGR